MGSAPVASDLVRTATVVSYVRHLSWRSDAEHLPVCGTRLHGNINWTWLPRDYDAPDMDFIDQLPPCDRCMAWAAKRYVADALIVTSTT